MQEKMTYTVVVADDEDELREALCRMVPWEELGFRLVGDASNGLDALELVEQLEPDLLLTDIRMPFISGIDLARQVREIRPSMHIAFLSGFDDFEYAKQAIQYNIISYMLKPITREGLIKELTAIREKMDAQFNAFRQQSQFRANRENFLMSLVLDDFPQDFVRREEKSSAQPGAVERRREEALRALAVECGLLEDETDRPSYVVAALCLTDQESGNITSPSMTHSMEMIAQKYFRHEGFYSQGKVVMVLLGNPSDFDEYLHILANEWLQMSERALHICCHVGVSRQTQELNQLHRAYREALEAMTFVEAGQSQVHFLSDTHPLTAVRVENLNEQVNRLQEAFKSGSREDMTREISALVGTGFASPQSKNWLDMAVLQLISEIYRVLFLAGGGEAVTALQDRGFFSGLTFHYRSSAELQSTLEEFCFFAMDTLSGLQKKGGDLLCRQALSAIDQHYKDEDLSLVSLSGMLNVSPNHLSACIKKYAGESFINILIRKRMETARELLLTTPMKIMEVAQQCGYSDQHYFSYCFKKYCGISPNMLRHQSRQEEEGKAQ
nr:response regulator [Fournierella massiliensis]